MKAMEKARKDLGITRINVHSPQIAWSIYNHAWALGMLKDGDRIWLTYHRDSIEAVFRELYGKARGQYNPEEDKRLIA